MYRVSHVPSRMALAIGGAGVLTASLLAGVAPAFADDPGSDRDSVAGTPQAVVDVAVTSTASADDPAPAPAAGSLAITLSKKFVQQLRSEGVRLEAVGTAVRTGRTITVPVYAPSARAASEVVLLTGGIALRDKDGDAYRCSSLAIQRSTGEITCGRGERGTPRFTAARFLATSPNLVTPDTEPTEQVRSAVTVAVAARANARLGAAVLTKDERIGTITLTLGDAPLRAGRDSRSGCTIDDWAGDNSINRGWAVQAMVNRIPKDVSVSQFDTASGRAPVPAAAPVTIGQRTPKMNGISVTTSKQIIRGSEHFTDNFYNGPSYGCGSKAPYIVGQGGLDQSGVQAWNYDGALRAPSNAGGARAQWWGHARQTNYDGPTGYYTWTCRGLPTGQADTYWGRTSQGTGFIGDGNDRDKPNSGRAPECRDENMAGFTLTSRYSISKRGGLEARDDQATYPRFCSVEGNDLVGCWQEIYPLEWDRAWAFQNHVYASALRTVLESNTSIRLPNEYTDIPGTVQPLAWRISDGDISGAWPSFTDAFGARRDMSGVSTPLNLQDVSKPSPFTVPAGLKDSFTLAGYGTPMGNQQMTFLLTGDSDGTWSWPTSKVTGRPLQRPQIRITVGYTISNFDDGGSCKEKLWYDYSGFVGGRGNDASGPHCLEGQVPTIWPLPQDGGKMWRRQIDEFITDKDGKRVRNAPTTSFDATVLASCYKKDELIIQDSSPKTAPVVGADYTWNIRLAGTLTSLTGC
jgi:hypothetical protein